MLSDRKTSGAAPHPPPGRAHNSRPGETPEDPAVLRPTPRQLEVILAIRRRVQLYGFPPTMRELATDLGISLHATEQNLQLLARKGLVAWEPFRSRTLRLIGGGA